MKLWLPAFAALLVAGCSTAPPSGKPVSAPSRKATTTKAAPTRARTIASPTHSATPQLVPGVQGVIGSDAAALVRQFGPPRLDIVEGDARKLQWSGTACVLDAYLYPPESGGGVQRVTFVDTRLPSGVAADQAACISVLENPN